MTKTTMRGLRRYFCFGRESDCRNTDTTRRRSTKSSPKCSVFLLLLSFVIVGIFTFSRLLNTITVPGRTPGSMLTTKTLPHKSPKRQRTTETTPLNCTAYNHRQTCPLNYATNHETEEKNQNQLSSSTCPDYFRWIHEDLSPWAQDGLTKEMIHRARIGAYFKLVIVNGKAYVEQYRKSFQSRDVYTVWGILQLLRRYPGKVPDLELMFDSEDVPNVESGVFSRANATVPPPLFRYCGHNESVFLVFPDWSFWGWPEVNIKPWEALLKDLQEGNKKSRWVDREPYAYWKGNPYVSETRHQVMRCSLSYKQKHNWNVQAYALNWTEEIEKGFEETNLASQCNYRYKIYLEGYSWSVSEKYILACNSPTLIVKPQYYDFFTRNLMPMHHYWPIRDDEICKSLKFAVDWGNTHKQKAQEIGKAASGFIQEELKMDYVYDYMFHLLNEYAKLLRFKPTIPKKSVEVCLELLACSAEGLKKKFLMESMVKGPVDSDPCKLPPPFDPLSLNAQLRRKENSIKQLEKREKNYWKKHRIMP